MTFLFWWCLVTLIIQVVSFPLVIYKANLATRDFNQLYMKSKYEQACDLLTNYVITLRCNFHALVTAMFANMITLVCMWIG